MMKKIIVYIVNFFLVICIFTFVTLLILSNTILNKKYVTGILEKNNYYEKTYYDIQDGFKNYIMQSGLEESILEDLYDIEKVHEDVNIVIDAIYENKQLNINIDIVKEKLDDRINDVLRQNNKKIGSEEKKSIQTFENVIIDVYKTGISYSENYISQISSIIEKSQQLVMKAEIIFAIIIVILILSIVIINKNLRETIKTLSITFITVGIANIALKILVLSKVKNILILNLTFSESVISLITSIINTFFIMGIGMVIIGVLVTIINSIKE